MKVGGQVARFESLKVLFDRETAFPHVMQQFFRFEKTQFGVVV